MATRQARIPDAPRESVVYRVLYEVGLLAAATVFLLAAIHGAFTSHLAVERVVDDSHVVATDSNAAELKPGDEFPVYRFGPDWKTAIGQVSVESVQGDWVLFRFDSSAFRWPMGRHGVITEARGATVRVNMGANLGLVASDMLIVFDGRKRVGRILLKEVGTDDSVATAMDGNQPLRPGLGVSEFLVPTQIVVFDSPLIAAIEIMLPCLVLIGYALGWMRLRRSPVEAIGASLRKVIDRFDKPLTGKIVSLLAGPAVMWVAASFIAHAVPYLLRAGLGAVSGWLRFDARELFAWIDALGRFLNVSAPAFAAVGLVVYVFLLYRRQVPPLRLFWQAIDFRGGPVKILAPGRGRDAVIWLLHLVIAYFFAYSLLTFLKGNLNAALDTAWQGSGVRVAGAFTPAQPSQIWELLRSALTALGHMVTHAPSFANGEAAWITARYLLWSLTICGCLLGYVHSILGYLWGKRIRNLDFTVAGWVSNAVCYGPLLGVVIWQMAPPLQGPDPIFASGPLVHLDLATEFFLDLVYTLTIWNLGTMFGVMTDKGVRRTGFYSVVRHPSYTMEALMFIALELRGLTSGWQWCAAGVFLLLYWIRSEREDVFMSRSNPDYVKYRADTRFKFIPGLY